MSPYVLLGLALALLALGFVLYPIVRPTRPLADHASQEVELAEGRQAIYQQILDVEFDQRVGKLSLADARELSEALLGQAADLLPNRADALIEQEAEIEREIRAVRRILAVSAPQEPERAPGESRPVGAVGREFSGPG